MPDPTSRLTFTALTLVCSGCLGVIHTPYQETNQDSVPVKSDFSDNHDYFAYIERPVMPERQLIESAKNNKYDQYELIFHSSAPDALFEYDIKATYYRSRLPAAKPLIIILPIWGSYTYPPEKLVNKIRKKSRGTANILSVDGKEPLFDWNRMKDAATEQEFIELSRLYYEKTWLNVIELSRMVEWAESETDLDAGRIGITGFSMGAIVAAMTLGRDQRFRAGVLAMGAGKFGEVFATCNGKPGDVRDAIMTRFDWTRDQYQAIFDELFQPVSPESFRGRYQPEKLLIVEASLDNCMSSSAREALWQATGQPERIRLLARHKPAFLSMTPVGFHYTTRQIYRFLARQLQISTDRKQCTSPESSC